MPLPTLPTSELALLPHSAVESVDPIQPSCRAPTSLPADSIATALARKQTSAFLAPPSAAPALPRVNKTGQRAPDLPRVPGPRLIHTPATHPTKHRHSLLGNSPRNQSSLSLTTSTSYTSIVANISPLAPLSTPLPCPRRSVIMSFQQWGQQSKKRGRDDDGDVAIGGTEGFTEHRNVSPPRLPCQCQP